MKKHIALILCLSAIYAATARAETMPSELFGTWSVSLSKTTGPSSLPPFGCQTFYIFKSGGEKGFSFIAYNDCIYQGIVPSKATVISMTYANRQLKIVTSDPDSNGVQWAFEDFITFTKDHKPLTGKGKFRELNAASTVRYGKMNISAVLTLAKVSDATEIPVRKPEEPPLALDPMQGDYYNRLLENQQYAHTRASVTMPDNNFMPTPYYMQGSRTEPHDFAKTAAECPNRLKECLQRCTVPIFGEDDSKADQAACKEKCAKDFVCEKK